MFDSRLLDRLDWSNFLFRGLDNRCFSNRDSSLLLWSFLGRGRSLDKGQG